MTTVAERLMVRAARRRDPRAAERLEWAIRNQRIDAIMKRNATRKQMICDDGIDHTWPVPMLTRPASRTKRPRRGRSAYGNRKAESLE
jgi:hypothetical protein